MPDGDPSGDFLYLTDVSPQDKPWDVQRAYAQRIEGSYRQEDFTRYADRISQCSRLLEFKLVPVESGQCTLKLDNTRFCRVRHCPVCQWRRKLMWYARFFTALPKVMRAYPTGRFLFLTLTVRNCPITDLRASVRHMNQSWQRLTQRREFPALGWAKSLEVTRSQIGEAHPHFHCLLLVPSSYFGSKYVRQRRWLELWQQCLRVDYEPSVHIRAVSAATRSDSSAGQGGGEELHQEYIRGILECFKYSVKPEDLVADPAWLAELTRQLHNTRAVSIGGVLRDFIRDEEPDDLIHAEGEEILLPAEAGSVLFGWHERFERYIKTPGC